MLGRAPLSAVPIAGSRVVVVEPSEQIQPHYGGRRAGRRLDEPDLHEIVQKQWELLELRRVAQAERAMPPAPVVQHQQKQPIQAMRPVKVRTPDAQPSRVVTSEGDTIDTSRTLALLIALSELDD